MKRAKIPGIGIEIWYRYHHKMSGIDAVSYRFEKAGIAHHYCRRLLLNLVILVLGTACHAEPCRSAANILGLFIWLLLGSDRFLSGISTEDK